MPYKRSYRRRGAKRVRKTRGKGLNKKEKHQVKMMIKSDVETKYILIRQSNLPFVTSGNLGLLTQTTQGLTDNNARVGDQIVLIGNLDCRLFVHVASSGSTEVFQYARVIFFQWKESTTPLVSQILQIGAGGGIDYSSQYVRDNRSLYKILFDKTYTFVGNSNIAGNPMQSNAAQFRRYFIKYSNRKINYIAASTTVQTNGVYILTVGSPECAYFYTATILYDDA